TIYKAYLKLKEINPIVEQYFKSHKVVVNKIIPEFAGLGGGSSNSATFILMVNDICSLGLSKDQLSIIGASIGADVPFFIYEYDSANVSGIGEIVQKFDEETLNIKTFTPKIQCNTGAIFKSFRENFYKECSKKYASRLFQTKSKDIFNTLDIKIAEILVDISLALYMFIEFKRWELKPFQSPAILWVLHLCLFWLPTAFLLSSITLIGELTLDTSFYYLNVHLLALGFLTTVLIGFGTRVTLGHSGQPPMADALTTKLFLFTQVVVLLRALYSLNIGFGWGANFLFDITFSAWLILFLIWGFVYGRVLVFGTKL
ncbi:MAG: NnrS family protein, partial [Campylobacterales bacterium]